MAQKAPVSRAITLCSEIARACRGELAKFEGHRWPATKWQQDPVGFVRQILKVDTILPHQESILLAVRDEDKVAVTSGQKVGKCVHIATPIPTPDGWVTMGDLQVGDKVFDDNGGPCNVTYVSPVYIDRQCYNVEFTDETSVIADAEHQWEVWTSSARRNMARGLKASPTVVTTQQMLGSLDSKHRGKEYAIRLAAPPEYPKQDLPIDPYVLGVWLGDGDTAGGRITIADRDADIVGELASRGYDVHSSHGGRNCRTYSFDHHSGISLHRQLRAYNFIGNKHVPAKYLISCYADRLALLQGLLDTDGTILMNGRIEFSNNLRNLAEAVFELAASLGMRPCFSTRRAKLNGRDYGEHFRVGFHTTAPVFFTTFKRNRLAPDISKDNYFRTIKSITPVATAPMKCIQVDSPSSLYLCTKSYLPTHNTATVVWLALWAYCCFPEANVIMGAATKEQIQRVLWRELKATIRKAKKANADFDIETPAENPSTGLRSKDGRSILGFTVREREAMAGISGGNLFFIGDEASALTTEIAEAIEGNTAGGGKVIWISNPTRTEGPFFDAFYSKKRFWTTFQVSSEKVAKYLRDNKLDIPGIANMRTIERWEEEYKRDSPFFRVRVLGEFIPDEKGKIIDLDTITQAQLRYDDTPDDHGDVAIGIDVAGGGNDGDEWAFSVVRGKKLVGLYTFAGLTEDSAITHAKDFVAIFRSKDGSNPRIMIDSEGPLGSRFYYRMKGISNTLLRSRPELAFDTYGVRASMPAVRRPIDYQILRDELWANLADWLKDGGAIPPDHKLEQELHAPNWIGTLRGKYQASPKKFLRDILGRSPDRADSLCLAVWIPAHCRTDAEEDTAPEEDLEYSDNRNRNNHTKSYDPYGSDGGYDPYR